MNRQFKFRVWNTVLKEYVSPNLIIQKDGLLWLENEDNLYEIEQYTGLTDKNGTEIYEGDIIAVETCLDEEEITFYEVYWDEDTLEYALRTLRGINYDSCVGELSPSSVIVIANIHENPELLGGEE